MNKVTNVLIISTLSGLTQTFENNQMVKVIFKANSLIFQLSDDAREIPLYNCGLKIEELLSDNKSYSSIQKLLGCSRHTISKVKKSII